MEKTTFEDFSLSDCDSDTSYDTGEYPMNADSERESKAKPKAKLEMKLDELKVLGVDNTFKGDFFSSKQSRSNPYNPNKKDEANGLKWLPSWALDYFKTGSLSTDRTAFGTLKLRKIQRLKWLQDTKMASANCDIESVTGNDSSLEDLERIDTSANPIHISEEHRMEEFEDIVANVSILKTRKELQELADNMLHALDSIATSDKTPESEEVTGQLQQSSRRIADMFGDNVEALIDKIAVLQSSVINLICEKAEERSLMETRKAELRAIQEAEGKNFNTAPSKLTHLQGYVVEQEAIHKTQLQDIKNYHAQKTNKIAVEHAEMRKNMESLRKEKDLEIKGAKDRFQRACDAKDRVTVIIAQLRIQLADQTKIHGTDTTHLQQAHVNAKAFMKQRHQMELTGRNIKIQKLDEELETTRKSYDADQCQIFNLQSCNELEIEVDGILNENNKLMKEIATVKRELATSQKELKKVQIAHKESHLETEYIKFKLEQCRSALKFKVEEIRQYVAEIRKMKAEQAASEGRSVKMEVDLDSAIQEKQKTLDSARLLKQRLELLKAKRRYVEINQKATRGLVDQRRDCRGSSEVQDTGDMASQTEKDAYSKETNFHCVDIMDMLHKERSRAEMAEKNLEEANKSFATYRERMERDFKSVLTRGKDSGPNGELFRGYGFSE